MINTRLFSQRDTKWKYDKMGKSGFTIGGYGCTITCLASLLCYFGYDETPKTVNQKLSSNGGYYKNTALVVWSAIPKIWGRLKYIKRAYNYNNVEVAWYIYAKKIPVMVEVNAWKIGAARHWCLYLGDRYMLDPWTGKGVSTSTYPQTGYTLYSNV
jgi:hypothetical protein